LTYLLNVNGCTSPIINVEAWCERVWLITRTPTCLMNRLANILLTRTNAHNRSCDISADDLLAIVYEVLLWFWHGTAMICSRAEKRRPVPTLRICNNDIHSIVHYLVKPCQCQYQCHGDGGALRGEYKEQLEGFKLTFLSG
jgi:hypothetical protein